MASQCSIQTASNCQSNVLSPFNQTRSSIANHHSKAPSATFLERKLLNEFFSHRKLVVLKRSRSETSTCRSLSDAKAFTDKATRYKLSSNDSQSSDVDQHLTSSTLLRRRRRPDALRFDLINFLIKLILFVWTGFRRSASHRTVNAIQSVDQRSHHSIDLQTRSTLLNYRSFLKQWPLIFLNKLASNCSNLFKFLFKNGIFRLLLISSFLTGYFAVPVSANVKISIPGDILLGGIFPVHQKGERDCSFV